MTDRAPDLGGISIACRMCELGGTGDLDQAVT